MKRFIKVTTSLLAVFILVVSSAFSASAALSVIRPSKLTPTIVNNGDGIYTYTYRLPTAPLWKVFADGQLIHQQQQEFSIYTSDYGASGDPLFRIRLFSTGAEPSTAKADCPVLDLTDFKTNSVLSFGFNVQIRLECTTGGSSNLTWSSLSAPEIYWYDADYRYIGKWTGTNTSIDLDATTPISFWALQNSYDISIPSNAVYCVPAATIRLYDPGQGSITNISSTHAEYFDFTVTKDSVIENSDTMKAIDKKFGELIDQNETIINGTPDQQEQADAMAGAGQDAMDSIDGAIDDLEKYPEVNSGDVDFGQLPTGPADDPDLDLSFDDLIGGKDFQVFNNFFVTLALDHFWIKMMIIVCTMVWISTLLFGRRA